MTGRAGMTGEAVVRGDAVFGRVVAKRDARNDRAGTAVGVGSVVAGGGLAGGGVPGARPNSGRLAHVARGTKYEATRHLVSAARGGVFGYREDAHRSFLNAKHKDLRGWRAGDSRNHFERGVAQGKTAPEKTIIRQLHRARTGSNVALAGGGLLAAGGLLAHDNKKRVGKRDDYAPNALLAGGSTVAVGGGVGSKVLEHQGRKWAGRTAVHIQEARKINPKLGGYEWNTTRHRKLLGPKKANVPDAKAYRSTNDIAGDYDAHAWQSHESSVAAGKHRGAATQSRYFARVYGSQARHARKVAAGGAVLAATGLAGKHYEIRHRSVSKQARIPHTRAHVNEAGRVFWPSDDQLAPRPRRAAKPEAKLVATASRGLGRKHVLIASGVSASAGAAGGYAAGRRTHDRKKKAPWVADWSPTAVHPTFPKQDVVRKAEDEANRATRRAKLPKHLNDKIDHVVHEVSSGNLQRQMQQNRVNDSAALRHEVAAPPKLPKARRGFPKKASVGVAVGAANTATVLYAMHRIRENKRRKLLATNKAGVAKVDTTMSEHEAHQVARQYDTRGPLPKGLSREQKMKAYEGRYIAAGGKKGERWKKRADRAEVGRNAGLVGATTSAAALLAARGKKTGPKLAANRITRHATPHRLETAALGSALGGGWSELYGEHARSRRASYANSPAGVAGSALTRMQAYTPKARTP
jgi:hypothetical protein